MNRNLRKSGVAGFIAIFFAIVMLFTVSFSSLKIASAEEISTFDKMSNVADNSVNWDERIENLEGKYYDYVNNDYGVTDSPQKVSIKDYETKLKGLNHLYSIPEDQLPNTNDEITRFIPKELFKHRGDYKYVGNEYGFFIGTKAYNESYSNKHENISIVMLFDVDINIDGFGLFTVRVTPLYSGTYMTRGVDLFLPEKRKEILANGLDCITYAHGDPSYANHFFSDFSITMNLNNMSCDDKTEGDYIKRTEFNYKGFSRKKNDGKDFTINQVKYWFGKGIKLVPIIGAPIGKALGYLKYANSTTKGIFEVNDTYCAGGANQYVQYYGDEKEEQLKNNGELVKSSSIGCVSSDKTSLLYNEKTEDFFEAKFYTKASNLDTVYSFDIDFSVKNSYGGLFGKTDTVVDLDKITKTNYSNTVEDDNSYSGTIHLLSSFIDRGEISDVNLTPIDSSSGNKNEVYALYGLSDKHLLKITNEGVYEFDFSSLKDFDVFVGGVRYTSNKLQIYCKSGDNLLEFFYNDQYNDPITRLYSVKEFVPNSIYQMKIPSIFRLNISLKFGN